jgi:LPS sulfotransferase NodH
MSLGLQDSHNDYTKFIILGRSRTGSNFLRGLLSSHSQIVVLGELLKNYNAIEWGTDGYPQTGRDLRIMQTDPARFLDTIVFRKYPRYVAAVGFKLFYYHAQQEELKPAWEHLRERKDIRVIHLKRRNILKTHLSRQRAEMTDLWTNVGGSKEVEKPIQLDYEKCLQDFIQTRQWEKDYALFFKDHPKIELDYEDLVADYVSVAHDIQDFLGVKDEPVKPQTHQQSHWPLSRAVANYAELRGKFMGSEWEEFFEE